MGKAADHPEACGQWAGWDRTAVEWPAQGEVSGDPEGPPFPVGQWTNCRRVISAVCSLNPSARRSARYDVRAVRKESYPHSWPGMGERP